MEFRPLQRSGKANNITRGFQDAVKSPDQAFSTSPGFTFALPVRSLVSCSWRSWGFTFRVRMLKRDKLLSEPVALVPLIPSSLLFWGTEDNTVARLQGLNPLETTDETCASVSLSCTLMAFCPYRVLSPGEVLGQVQDTLPHFKWFDS